MGLFSTLASASVRNDGKNVEETASSAETKSTSLPTVIQLYTSKQFVRLDPDPTQESSFPQFGLLNYSAVNVAMVGRRLPDADQALTSNSNHRHNRELQKPDLGVWNAVVTSSSPMTDAVLLTIPNNNNSNKFCLTVDVSNVSSVEPTLTLLQEALVRLLIAQDTSSTAKPTEGQPDVDPTATTTLYQLRSVAFGLAAGDDMAKSVSAPEPKDRSVRLSLMICAIWPTPAGDKEGDTVDGGGTAEDYRDKQAQALILYHLRRYADALNAALCFVDSASSTTVSSSDPMLMPTGSSDTDPQQMAVSQSPVDPTQPTLLSLSQLATLWQGWADGKEVWNDSVAAELGLPQQQQQSATFAEDSSSGADDAAAVTASPHQAVYGPGAQNAELIESVLLRNAQYPGHWDASKDSLWKILPQDNDSVAQNTIDTKGSSSSPTTTTAAASGDDYWLLELRDSVVAESSTKTPQSSKAKRNTTDKKAKGSKSKKPSKNDDDGEVSNFFESLLK